MPSEEEGEEQPKRERADEVPLGIRRPKAPGFDSSRFIEDQRRRDDEEERQLMSRAEEGDLESPEVHQDYEIRDGEEYDRHLEGVSSINALKELIAQAREEVEEELEVRAKPFSADRMDQLLVFAREAITGHGEEAGYAELRKRVRQLMEDDARWAEEELDRKKEAYLRSSGK